MDIGELFVDIGILGAIIIAWKDSNWLIRLCFVLIVLLNSAEYIGLSKYINYIWAMSIICTIGVLARFLYREYKEYCETKNNTQ